MKKINYFFLILALLAIPSSILSINELTKFDDSDLKIYDICETGVKNNYFKNCEYKFQFDLPTEYWDIYDVYENRALRPPYVTSSDTYWVVLDYLYGANDTSDAEGAVLVFDIRDTSFINFEDYNGMYFELMQNDTYKNLEYFSENNKFEFSYDTEIFGKLFSCYEVHEKRVSLVYLIRTCQYLEAQDADQIKNDIALFWRTFRFF